MASRWQFCNAVIFTALRTRWPGVSNFCKSRNCCAHLVNWAVESEKRWSGQKTRDEGYCWKNTLCLFLKPWLGDCIAQIMTCWFSSAFLSEGPGVTKRPQHSCLAPGPTSWAVFGPQRASQCLGLGLPLCFQCLLLTGAWDRVWVPDAAWGILPGLRVPSAPDLPVTTSDKRKSFLGSWFLRLFSSGSAQMESSWKRSFWKWAQLERCASVAFYHLTQPGRGEMMALEPSALSVSADSWAWNLKGLNYLCFDSFCAQSNRYLTGFFGEEEGGFRGERVHDSDRCMPRNDLLIALLFPCFSSW